MNKKGITWSTIIYGIIAIIVLITIAWIFREQLNEIYKGFTSILKTTKTGGEEVGKGLEDLIEQVK